MMPQRVNLRLALTAVGALGAALFTGSPASAHVDPAGCSQTGVGIVVSIFRTGGACATNADCAPPTAICAPEGICIGALSGVVSECEPIAYTASLAKAQPQVCAFEGGTFTFKTPDQ